MSLRVLGRKSSINVRKVLWTCAELDLDVEHVESDAKLLARNPNAKVPVLEDGEFVLWESGAIMQYLADRTHGQTLYPDNILVRADINRWMLWTAQHFAPPLGVIVYEHIWKGLIGNGGPDPEEPSSAGSINWLRMPAEGTSECKSSGSGRQPDSLYAQHRWSVLACTPRTWFSVARAIARVGC